MVCAHCRSAAGTANLIIPCLGDFPSNIVIYAPVKEVLFVHELHVRFLSCRLELSVCDHTIYCFVRLGGARAIFYGLLSPPHYLRRNQILKALSQDILPYPVLTLKLQAYFQGKANEILVKRSLPYLEVRTLAKLIG